MRKQRLADCKSCQAPMRWVTMERSGKKNPLDPEPCADGNIIIIDEELDLARGVSAGERQSLADAGAPFYKSHFVTCPDSAIHRRLKESEGQA